MKVYVWKITVGNTDASMPSYRESMESVVAPTAEVAIMAYRSLPRSPHDIVVAVERGVEITAIETEVRNRRIA